MSGVAGGAVRGKHTVGSVSWKLNKLDHLLLECSRLMSLPSNLQVKHLIMLSN